MTLPRPPWRTFAHPVSVTAAVVLAHAGALWALHSAWTPSASTPPTVAQVQVVVELRAQAPSARPAAPAAAASVPPPRSSAPAAPAASALPERAARPEPPAPAAPAPAL